MADKESWPAKFFSPAPGIMGGAGSLVVGVALVLLIPFLRKLITDKAEIPPAEIAADTVVPVVWNPEVNK